MINVGGLQISLEDLLSAMTKPQGGQSGMLRQAQAERAKKFGIEVQPSGTLRIPARFARLGAKVGDFADPVNFKFPVWLTKPDSEALTAAQMGQVRNAMARFQQFKDGYDTVSRAAVENRIDEARKKFGIGEFAEDKMEKAWACEVFKADTERQIIYSVALKASSKENGIRPDTQRDILTADTVEETAHRFMIESRTFDLHHKEVLTQKRAAVIESYLAPVDFHAGGTDIKKGDWIVAAKIFDKELWKSIKQGEINAFSIRGVGKRFKLKDPPVLT